MGWGPGPDEVGQKCLNYLFMTSPTKRNKSKTSQFFKSSPRFSASLECLNSFDKPTSVGWRFIHGSSHHPPSTFKSITFGEAIRLKRLNQRKEDYLTSLNRLQNKAKKSKFLVNMTNDMITLVSKWENRLHPLNPSDKKYYSVWPTSFPILLRLTKKEKTLNNKAMITYKRPTTVGQRLTNYRSLAHSEASIQQQRGHSGPCGHCALCGKFGKHNANMVPKVTALHSKGKLFPSRQVLTCANYGTEELGHW